MSGEKTEEPTPRRLEKARERGEVAKSRDLGTFVGLAAGALALAFTGAGLVAALRGLLTASFREVASSGRVAPRAFLEASLEAGFVASLPFLLVVTAIGAAVSYLEVGPLFAMSRVMPDLSRLAPGKALGQMVSKRTLVDVARSLVLLGLLAASLWAPMVEAVGASVGLVGRGADTFLAAFPSLASKLVARALAVLAVAAVVDVLITRLRHREDLKMTRDEVKREHKESEGDPHVKGERQRLHREMVEHQVLEAVRTADVLVVNPTHIAVALRFDAESEQEAPEVVAKGVDHLARRMIEVATEAGVPVLRDIPLARSLHGLDLGEEVPEALYEAVAAVLRAAWEERERKP